MLDLQAFQRLATVANNAASRSAQRKQIFHTPRRDALDLRPVPLLYDLPDPDNDQYPEERPDNPSVHLTRRPV
jgi:hypothetical protein